MPGPRTRTPEAAAMVRLSGELAEALQAIIDSSPLAGLGPIELARVLGVDKTLASRLMSALRATDPLVALSLLPGVVPMRQFIAAARRHGARARAVQDAERRLRAFDHELERSFGTRTRLDAVIADALPEARRRHGDVARQAVYRGMALIKGVSIDLENFTWVIHPSRRHPKKVDMLFLASLVGIHRLRPTARFRMGASYSKTRPEAGPRILRKFCRPAGLSITTTTERDFTFHEVSTGSVRRDAAADLFLTELFEGAASRADDPAQRGAWNVSTMLTYAIKRLEMSVLIREDVWPGSDFALRVYDTAMRGIVHLPDPGRESDRISVDGTITRSPASAEALRASAIPGYPEILRHLMDPLGWKLEGKSRRPAFRKITCEIAYPLYGSQVAMVRE